MKADHGRDRAGVKTHSGIGHFFTAGCLVEAWRRFANGSGFPTDAALAAAFGKPRAVPGPLASGWGIDRHR